MSPTTKKKLPGAKGKPVKPAAKVSLAKSRQSKAPVKPAAAQARLNVNVLVWLHAIKGKEEPIDRELTALVGPSRAEKGCLAFELHRSDQLGDFFLHEVWASQAALDEHWQTPHFKRWSERKDAILESRRRFVAE